MRPNFAEKFKRDMKHKPITLLLTAIVSIIGANAEEKSTTYSENNKSERTTLEFSTTKNQKSQPYNDSTPQLIGEIGDGFLSLDFTSAEGIAHVKCHNLMTGNQITYSTSANGTSYQYIGEVNGVLQITVTTAESSYECITVVE